MLLACSFEQFFVCGPCVHLSSLVKHHTDTSFSFPFSPGQYAAVCGPKDGMKQGEIKGALGELGYDNDHVFKF